MVFVKVRETYDLHTLPNKMSVIGIHTPRPGIVRRNYPGLLLQCKAWRPVSCDVKMACASMLPLDPQQVGTTEGDVAPEDIFNPILYKAVSNFSMSQIEQYIYSINDSTKFSARGDSLEATNDGLSSDDFSIYYGLLADTHGWKHASAQKGLAMASLRPFVYEQVYNMSIVSVPEGQTNFVEGEPSTVQYAVQPDGSRKLIQGQQNFRGKAKPMPWLPTLATYPTGVSGVVSYNVGVTEDASWGGAPKNVQVSTPSPRIYCGLIIVPPSRRHQLFYRMVCEWTLEFSSIRSLGEITSYAGLAQIGDAQHIMDYDFGESKVMTETTDFIDTSEDSGIKKVM